MSTLFSLGCDNTKLRGPGVNASPPPDSESDSESDGWSDSDVDELEHLLFGESVENPVHGGIKEQAIQSQGVQAMSSQVSHPAPSPVLQAFAAPKGPQNTPHADQRQISQVSGAKASQSMTARPTWTTAEREKMPQSLHLTNFVQQGGVTTLFRCEAAKGKNPQVSGLSALSFQQIHIFTCLFNSRDCIFMRTPDVKKNCQKPTFEHERTDEGIRFSPSANPEYNEIRFKKKCQDKQGNQTGFELGREYESYTRGTTPQFVFIAVPYANGYIKEKAVRSVPFRILSKRQERFLQSTQKRRRKNTVVEKLDTDIVNAKSTLRMVQTELRHENIVNSAMQDFFAQLGGLTDQLQNETAKISIGFALRKKQVAETASM